jgi:Skp family chaperone for outer membrane proteins
MIEGVEPRFPATIAEFRLVCAALAALCSPSAASRRLNEAGAALLQKIEADYRDKQHVLERREAECERRERGVADFDKELSARAEALAARETALKEAFRKMDAAFCVPKERRSTRTNIGDGKV